MALRITPTQAAFPRSGIPPSFKIETDGYLYFAVQVATKAILLNSANLARRSPANWSDSWVGDAAFKGNKLPIADRVPPAHLEAPTGKARYTLPADVWHRLEAADQLFYRAVVADDEKRFRHRVSLRDLD